MTSTREWYLGARPKTLPAAIAPVIAGTGLAVAAKRFDLGTAAAALVVALAIQVATNYANDYSDGIRGTDDTRVGPMRLVASGAATAAAVKRAAVLSFLVAGIAGIALAVIVSPWLILVGAASISAGWLYTGGPKPYGYYGLGEVFVFVFFGLVATCGTYYVQARSIDSWSLLVGAEMGLLSVAILVANNLRDIDGDKINNKHTLAVRLGAERTRLLYTAVVALSFVCVAVLGLKFRFALGALISVLAALVPIKTVRSGATGRDFLPVLAGTSRLLLLQAVLIGAGLALS